MRRWLVVSGPLPRRDRGASPVKPECPRQFLLSSSVEPSSPNFLSGTPPLLPSTFLQRCFSYNYVNFAHYTGQKNHIFLSAKSVLWPKNMSKTRFQPGLHPDAAGWAYDALPYLLVSCRGDTPPHTQSHLAPHLSSAPCSSYPQPKPGAPLPL